MRIQLIIIEKPFPVVKLTFLLADISDYQAVNETYKGFFSDNVFPARNIYQVSGLLKNARVMIDAVAYVEPTGQGGN